MKRQKCDLLIYFDYCYNTCSSNLFQCDWYLKEQCKNNTDVVLLGKLRKAHLTEWNGGGIHKFFFFEYIKFKYTPQAYTRYFGSPPSTSGAKTALLTSDTVKW